MADNFQFQSVTPASIASGETFAADDVGGVKYERVKLDQGGDGVSSPVTEASPLRTQLFQGAALVSASNPLYGTQIDQHGHGADVTFLGDSRVAQPFHLVGAELSGTTLDTVAWTTAVSGAGAAASLADHALSLASGTANSGYAQVTTMRKARFIFANPHVWRGAFSVPAVAVALNTRRWGAFTVSTVTPQNGFYFELSAAGVLSVVVVKGGTPTAISSGSFNGTVSSYVLDTNLHAYEIHYYLMEAEFYIDGVLVHSFAPTTTTLVSDMNLPCTATSVNSASGVTSGTLVVHASNIHRMGRERAQAFYSTTTGTQAGVVAKRGAGVIHRIIVSNVTVNSAITLYDNTAASGAVLWQSGAMAASQQAFSIDLFGIPFDTGLTIVVATAGCNLTVIYE